MEDYAQSWGLWSHNSWREMAVGGSYIFTTAFFSYMVANFGEHSLSYSRSIFTLAAGFFVPYTAAHFSTLQKANEIKTENLGIYNAINKKLSELELKYGMLSEGARGEKTILFHQLISVIKTATYSYFNMSQPSIEKNAQKNLLLTQQLLDASFIHLKQFAKRLPSSLADFDKLSLEEELRFWKRGLDKLEDDLITDNEHYEGATLTH